MAEITQEARSPKARDLFNKGFAAMERENLDYAIDMFTACLLLEPGFLQARKFLRAAEIKKARAGGTSPIKHAVSMIQGLPQMLKVQLLIKQPGKAMQALEAAEGLMRIDPLNREFIKLLGKAAVTADYPEIAIQTLSVAREFYPKDLLFLNWLGTLYMDTGQPKLARECFELLAELRPSDAKAIKSLKDAMAVDSMSKDGWADAAAGKGSFRNMMRNEKEAVLIEQENKSFKTEKDTKALIAESIEKIKQQPGNMNYRRHLAVLYTDDKQFDKAIETLREALKISGGQDPQIDNAIASVRLQQFDHQIALLEGEGRRDEAAATKKERDDFLFQDLKDRAARYANDLQIRFELGLQYYRRGDLNEAVQQFQLSQRNPHERVRSLYYLGLAFKQKKQYDIALEQLTQAVKDIPGMTDLKKDIYYEMGQIAESMGQKDKALEYFKTIYQVDIGYKDVAKRIEKGYAS